MNAPGSCGFSNDSERNPRLNMGVPSTERGSCLVSVPPRGSAAMLQLLRKFSIINRVFVSLVAAACLVAAVGGSAVLRLQEQRTQATELGRQARALEANAANQRLVASAEALADHSARSA